jgi:hypothetical protein
MWKRLLNNEKFDTFIALLGIAFLSYSIYDKYINIKRNKIEIEKLNTDEK